MALPQLFLVDERTALQIISLKCGTALNAYLPLIIPGLDAIL
jgi:hypothetical protein